MDIIDIRRANRTFNLYEDIIHGLRGSKKSLPSLLLWDDTGLGLFDEICGDASYYPAKREMELLVANMANVAKTIAAGSCIIELGSGNTGKTAILLKTLADQTKAFDYFALDVSPMKLQSNLQRLAKAIPEAARNMHGICGTYEDLKEGMSMNHPLGHLPTSNLTFLWLGNSVANAPAHESFALLAELMATSDQTRAAAPWRSRVQAIVSIDGCQDEAEVLAAYGLHTPAHASFLMHALAHTNTILGKTVFAARDWDISTIFDTKQGLLTQNFVAKENTEARIDGELFDFERGELINICQSGKWSGGQVEASARCAGLSVSKVWQTRRGNYGIYLLHLSHRRL